MSSMFFGASSFDQNLGAWYVTLDNASIDLSTPDAVIGTISAQNSALDGHNPVYGLGGGGDSGLFVVNGAQLGLNPDESHSAGTYTADITATGNVGTDNSHTISVTVTGDADPPTPDAGAFVTVWKTTSAGESITIPVGDAGGSYTVDWGDGTAPATHTSDATHTYAATGSHTVSISGDFTRIHLGGNSTNAPKLVSIEQWGDIEWDTMENAFYGASDMVYNATDTPDLSGVGSMSSMFRGASSFNGDLSDWNVSSVTNMSNMFQLAFDFNQPLNAWNVSSVTDMGSMFYGAFSFDQPLNAWDVSSVTDMEAMFQSAPSFNQPLGDWDVSSVTDMDDMFLFASTFNQNLGNWYIVLDNTSIDLSTPDAVIGTISAQNQFLDGHNPAYGLGGGGDSGLFVISATGNTLELNPGESHSAGTYTANITATGDFGTDNSRTISVTVTGDVPSTLDAGAFVTVWETTSPNRPITIPVGNAGGNYTVDWGDDTAPTTHTSDATHTYAAAGSHTVSISGDFTRIYLDGQSINGAKLVSIEQWGDIQWESMARAFYGAPNMIYNATDTPDLSRVTSMAHMFRGASSFDGDISPWNVSSVTNMAYMFDGASSFDRPLDTWNVSSVTSMRSMFMEASSFDQPLNAWNVSSVTNMNSMFLSAISFDQPLNAWNVSSVTNMNAMFSSAQSFSQPLNAWDVSSVTSMNSMFDSVFGFNQPLNAWNVSSVTDMSGMFDSVFGFNQPLNAWNVSSVTDMQLMFNSASDFNGDLSSWNVSSVTDMSDMFRSASDFNGDLSSWNVSSVTDMNAMFFGASSFDQPLGDWDVSSVTDMTGMFLFASSFDQNLGAWYVTLDNASIDLSTPDAVIGTISAQNSALDGHNPVYGLGGGGDSGLFVVNGAQLGLNPDESHSAGTYTADITATGNVGTDNSHTISVTVTGDADPPTPDAGAFVTVWKTTSAGESITIPVGDAGGSYTVDWGDDTAPTTHTSNATHTYAATGNHTVSISGDFTRIHLDGNSTNAPKLVSIEQWGDIEWDTMENAFYGASDMVYNADDTPDLSGVGSMSNMFRGASSFDGDISSWNVSSVTDMSYMFSGASSFAQPLGDWDVSSVTDMSYMFGGASSFAQPLGDWDVSSVTDMSYMFIFASSFNQSLGEWDVSGVTDMGGMFTGASSFDGDLSGWNVSSVTNMESMFFGATFFNQPLGEWDVSGVTDMSSMFLGATFFNQPLGEWDVSGVTHMGSMFLGATSFNQPLGGWYVVPNSTEIERSAIPGVVGSISAQNSFLDGQNPTYSITSGSDSAHFGISGGNLLNMTSDDAGQDEYTITVAASGSALFGSGNQQTVAITVTGQADTDPPTFVSADYTTGNGTLVIAFSEPISQTANTTGLHVREEGSGSGGATLTGAGYTVDGDTLTVTLNQAQRDTVAGLTSPALDIDAGAVSDLENNRIAASVDNKLTVTDTIPPAFESADYTTGNGTLVIAFSEPISSTANTTGLHVREAGSGSGGATLTGAGYTVDGDTLTVTLNQAQRDTVAGLTSPALDIDAGAVSDLENNRIAASVDNKLTVMDTIPPAFITTWETTAADEPITIPGTGTYTVNWGDGQPSEGATGPVTHEYASPGNHTVHISGGLERINLGGDGANAAKLRSIDQWGGIAWTSMQSAFRYADGMTYGAADAPDLSGVTTMSYMFNGASDFNGNLSSWNVSQVADMSHMFRDAASFNQPLGDWDVSSVTSMNHMFDGASDFNQPLGDWDVSSVTSMNNMFDTATSFNQPLGDWDVSSVTSMNNMFDTATSFNRPLGDWDVSSVTSMNRMFDGATNFNGDLSSWDVSDVTAMSYMFDTATSFNQPLGDWDVSSVTSMNSMFLSATSFNQSLGDWDVLSVTSMRGMFYGASDFNQPLGDWNVSSVTDMGGMFLSATSFNRPLGDWDVSSVTDMGSMFLSADSFNQNLGNWYIVLDSTSIDLESGAAIGNITAQNGFLNGQNPAYGIGPGGDSGLFVISATGNTWS